MEEAILIEETCDLLLTGGIVITMDDDRRILDPGAVAVRDGRIVAVGTPEELAHLSAERVIDASGSAVIPGLIDCHNHLFQLLGRGLGEGMALWPWLCDFMWPYSANITRAEALAGVKVGSLEAAKAGTTCIVDNHYAPADLETVLGVAATVEEVGLRGVIARGITGEMTDVAKEHGLSSALFQYSSSEELAITRSAMEARANTKVTVWPAPLNVIYVNQELVRSSVELAREFGVKWHTHCSEAEQDPVIYMEAYGVRPFEWLHSEGLLGPDATIAHAMWLDDEEVRLAGETNTALSYNPQSNQYLASGPMRLGDLQSAGAVIGVGSDGAAGHSADMFQVMKQAVYVQRQHTLDPESVSAQDALYLATRGGAEYVGIDAGQLSVGSLADLAVVDLTGPHAHPLHDVVSVLVYSCTGADVKMTIVGGDVIVDEGLSTLVDQAEVIAEASFRGGELASRANFDSRLRG